MKSHIVFLTLFSLIAFQIYGMQPKEEACNNLELVRIQEEIDRKTEEWKTKSQVERNQALLDAAEKGHETSVEFLIVADAEINARNKYGNTPLHLAAHKGHETVIQALLAAKAEVNPRDKGGYTPLHLAAQNGHKTVIQALLATKAEINARDYWNIAPLHLAAQNDHLEVVKALLAAKAEINARNKHGNTPLHLAAIHGYTAVVDLLRRYEREVAFLMAGLPRLGAESPAQVLPPDIRRYTLELVRIQEIQEWIDSWRAKPQKERNQALLNAVAANVEANNVKLVKILLAAGANVNARSKGSMTPLHIAAIINHLELTKVLCNTGANVNDIDQVGYTPLHCAIDRVSMLTSTKDILCPRDHLLEEVQALLDANADANGKPRDPSDTSPLDLAVFHGDTEVANLLRAYGATE